MALEDKVIANTAASDGIAAGTARNQQQPPH
jgi:hypothetical protein